MRRRISGRTVYVSPNLYWELSHIELRAYAENSRRQDTTQEMRKALGLTEKEFESLTGRIDKERLDIEVIVDFSMTDDDPPNSICGVDVGAIACS